MFDSISDRIRQEEGPTAKGARILRWAMVTGVSVLLFGGLYLLMQHLEH